MKIRRILCWLLSLALLTGSIYTADTLVRQRRLARKTVRLHVIANSDEAADQAQKLRVRDGVLACVSGLTADCETADDARKCIAAHLPEIAEAAQRVLAGSGYDVTVSLGPETYGTRDYASFSLPAGTYPSLRVQIGEAAGKNWWCVVFPTLCTAATSDEAELQAAAGGFDEDEAAWITEEQPEYRLRFKTLEWLQRALELDAPPERIEAFDISNLGDTGIVAGMTVFQHGRPRKSDYRKFRIRTTDGQNDYGSMHEAVTRRFQHYVDGDPGFCPLPDLLLIDGGRGQVSAVKQALRGTALEHVPTFGMVKDDHHRTRAIVDSDGREIAINMNRGTFTFITAIQDETHRFANAYRKQQMKQKSYSSTLTEVPGVGPKTAKALMARFKSVSAVREAAMDQLENTPGVGPRLARTIYDHFHPQN